jgi:hypothetical protein
MEEVAEMEIYTMTRPSMPLNRAVAPVAVPAAVWAPISVPVLAAERVPAQREHQVQIQAELAQALTLATGISGTTGSICTTSTTSTTGFKGINVSKKRYADGGSGVPPRGRPV